MKSSPGCSPVSTHSRKPIPLRPKAVNRFYEPIILLDGLNKAWKDNQVSRPPDLSLDPAQSRKLSYYNFVNKLGQLCDSERYGKTVTALAVLQFPGFIQYRFASNQRGQKDLIHAKEFVLYLLQTISKAGEDELEAMISHILRKVLCFNRPRVESYAKSLKNNSVLCVKSCKIANTDECKSIIKKLDGLRELQCRSEGAVLNNETFSEQSEELIYAIDRIYQSEVDEFIREKTKEGRINESIHWCELRHATGRLLSYLQAVKVLFSTRKQWPELFEDFKVEFISSSSPSQCPLRKRNNIKDITAESIIGRMTSDSEIMSRYRACAQELEKFGLNEMIQEQAGSNKFRPIVHAEVLLLQSLEGDGGTHPSRFFNSLKYIGCSKPSCRLCHYYFTFHPSGVAVRPTHRNLYPNWRIHDVYEDQNPNAVKERDKIMDKILVVIREDAFRTLGDKVPERKNHDSNTEPTYPIDNIEIRDHGNVKFMTTVFEGLKIEDLGEDEVLPNSSPNSSTEVSGILAAESDDEEEHGGVKL